MKIPKVSVVMPAYNHEKYVGEAIESVLNQSFADFEFIIINDGSTDNTDKVIRNYNDKRIRYYTQENSGAFNALNRGIALAHGAYVSIINSDDVYHKERFSYLIEAVNKFDAVFLLTNIYPINENSSMITDPSHPWILWFENLLRIYKETNSLEKTFYKGNIAATTSNFFLSRKIVEEIGGFKPYRYAHDYDYALCILQRYPKQSMLLPEKQYLGYRIHGSNTISEAPIKVNKEVFDILLYHIWELAQNKKDAELKNMFFNAMNDNRTGLIDIKDNQLIEKELYTQALLNSYSWKITAPLRAVMRLLLR